MAYFELEAPQLALRPSSTVSLYAQTESGRKAAEAANGEDFDISVPGTVPNTILSDGTIVWAAAGTKRNKTVSGIA